MDCICLKRRRKKRGQQTRNNKGSSGLQNSAYVKDEDDDILKNNAVLAELEQRESETRLSETGPSKDNDTRSGSSLNGETSSLKVTSNVLYHTTPSDKLVDTELSHSLSEIPSHTQDDLCLIDHYNYECVEVDLVSKDSLGPGFSVNGTLTDGIIIGSLSDKGPAMDSGKVSIGDRIMSVTIGFTNMAYEDALTILSYASPYPMTLQLARGPGSIGTLSASPTKELHNLSTGVYHPVYRSQSVGGGTSSSKKQRKIPSRPGTSLSQIDYATLEANEGSQTSLEGSLVKDKFGNTLNLIGASDSSLHRQSDSDTTVDGSVRSESRLQSATRLAETSEEVATAFYIPVQAVACSMEPYPVIAEVMITEPPTQIKLASLASSPTSEQESRATSPTSPNQVPPEKPKRVYQLIAEGEVPSHPEASSEDEQVKEEEILPTSKPKVVHTIPDWVGNETRETEPENQASVEVSSSDITLEAVEMADSINEASSPIDEPIITPSHKTKELKFSNTDWLAESEPEGTFHTATVHTATVVVKPSTLTVDTVKIKDAENLLLETTSAAKQCNTISEQPSPNDSGIHSENAPSEEDVEEITDCLNEAGGGSSSPPLASIRQAHSSGDLVLGLPSVNESTDNYDDSETHSTSSQATTPRKLSLTGLFGSSYVQQPIKRRRPRPKSAGSAPKSKFTQPEPVVPKATSRSQLEAARARFFAELMQSSDIFKDSPDESLSFSSDSLNVDPSEKTTPDPFKKYTNKSLSDSTNNNSLSNTSYPQLLNDQEQLS